MAHFKALPNELIVQTLADLPNSDLASVSRVSRRLRNICQPRLYRDPHLRISERHQTSFDRYFSTLLTPACESLGSYARCLTIDWKSRFLQHNDLDVPFRAAARIRFALGRTTALSEIKQISLLLQLLPRLEALHIRVSFETANLKISTPMERYQYLPRTLRDFTYDWCASKNWITTENLLGVLLLPRIRSITISQLFSQPFPDAERVRATAAAGTSSLTHLTIYSRRTEELALRYILSVPRALTHFSFKPVMVNLRFDFPGLGLALLPLKHSLSSLELDFRNTAGPRVLEDRTTTIGSLRDWAALRNVTCTLLGLLATDSPKLAWVLPAGIRTLEILGDRGMPLGQAMKEVVDLLAAREMVPALERVCVYAGRNRSKKLRRRLKKACWAVGVMYEER